MFCPQTRGEGQNNLNRYGGPIMSQQKEHLDEPQQTDSTPSPETSRDASHELSPEEFRRRYLEQQRRLACPGCGEEPFLG